MPPIHVPTKLFKLVLLRFSFVVRYLGPNGCLSFLVVQTIASLEQKAKGIDADGDGKVRARAAARVCWSHVCCF